MKFFTVSAAVFIILTSPVVLAQTSEVVSVSYDDVYDEPNGPLLTVACSDGAHGLYSNYHTFSSIPSFPNIGGAPAIAGYNSPACGSCWQLTYGEESINITAIDVGGRGFNIALAAINALTADEGVKLGRVNATAMRVDPAGCGLPTPVDDDDEDEDC